jgi:rRNA processing protein Gar1
MDILTLLNLIGFTLDVIGKILVGYTAVAVHMRFRHEHKVDNAVFKAMKKEHSLALFGIGLIVVGYFLQLPTKI